MSSEASEEERPPLAHDDTVVFVEEDAKGNRRFVGRGGGNFFTPLEISKQAESMLAMMVDMDSVPIGAKVGIIRVLGRGANKQVTVHCEVDEEMTRDDYEYTHDCVTDELDRLRTE